MIKDLIMEFFSMLFTGKSLNIFAVAVIFFSAYLILQFIVKTTSLHPQPLLILSIAWGMYSVWELFVQIQTPEANIRIDLFVIWPILVILTVWKLFRIFRS